MLPGGNTKTPLLDDYKRRPLLSNKSIFRLRVDDLQIMFKKKNIKKPVNAGECRLSLNILKDCGYTAGVCELLSTDPVNGINGDKDDIKRRKDTFGNHSISLPKVPSFFTFFARQFEDPLVILLIWMAVMFLGLSFFEDVNPGDGISVPQDASDSQAAFGSQVESKALLECLSIFAGLLFAAFITALCDYKKESQILILHDEINNAIVTVYRGSFGNTIDIPVRDLVVGDIVDIKQGDRVPADCLLVEEMNITVDQSLYFKDKDGSGDTLKVAKEPSEFYGAQS